MEGRRRGGRAREEIGEEGTRLDDKPLGREKRGENGKWWKRER